MKLAQTLVKNTSISWLGLFDIKPLEHHLHWYLRFGAALSFLGHGLLTLFQKSGFFPQFFSPENLTWIGALEIFLGSSLLLHFSFPLAIVLVLWGLALTLWGLFLGEQWWEFFEHAYLFCTPLALLIMSMDERKIPWAKWVMRLGLFATLMGHGGYGVFLQKPLLIYHYGLIYLTALFHEPPFLNFLIGTMEMVLAIWVLIKPGRNVLLTIFCWKILSESLHILSGSPYGVWEFMIRGGCFVLPLAILTVEKILHRDATLV